MMKKFALAVMTLAFVVGAAYADITYAPFIFNAYDDAGAPIQDGTILMVIDLDGDGWDGNPYASQSAGAGNADSWLWDEDDMLLDISAVGVSSDSGFAGEATPFRQVSTSEIPTTYDADVDTYYLIWFDVAFDALATGPGADVSYGVDNLGTVGADPGDYTPFATGGNATLTTVAGGVDPCAANGAMADFNCDDVVGLLDLDILGQNWGVSGLDPLTSYESGDANADGIVGLLDLDILGQNWGTTITPEPASLSLLVLAGLTAIRRR